MVSVTLYALLPSHSSLRSAPKCVRLLVSGLVAAVVATGPLAAQERFSIPTPAPNSPVWGGVPTGPATLEPLTLSLAEALRRALSYNLGVLIADEAVNRAEGTRRVALSELLPRFEGGVTETRRKTNLEAFGFPLGPTFPRVVGPFNVFDARVTLRQAIFDARATNDLHAESHRLAAVQLSRRSERDLIVLVAANVYLQTVAASARAAATRRSWKRLARFISRRWSCGRRRDGRHRRRAQRGRRGRGSVRGHRGAQRLRENQTAAGAPHRTPGPPGLHDGGPGAIAAGTSAVLRGGAGARLHGSARLPGRAGACSRGRSRR